VERDFKLKNDPRITRIGRMLRVTSFDELPQLFNVLKGDMSLVGPRPIVAKEVARYGSAFHDYASCRPGITGAWQVSGRKQHRLWRTGAPRSGVRAQLVAQEGWLHPPTDCRRCHSKKGAY